MRVSQWFVIRLALDEAPACSSVYAFWLSQPFQQVSAQPLPSRRTAFQRFIEREYARVT